MAHNDECGKQAEAHVEKSEAEREAEAKRDWEDRESFEVETIAEKMQEFPGAYFDPEDLEFLRLNYVPDPIRPCPHCENSRKSALRKELYAARSRMFYESQIEHMQMSNRCILFGGALIAIAGVILDLRLHGILN